MSTKFSVVGLGKLGASLAAVIADRGFKVIGVDTSKQAVNAVNGGHAPVAETDLEGTISRNAERINATGNHLEAVAGSEVTFVTVPTPSDEKGAFVLDYAIAAMQAIGTGLRHKNEYHLVVLVSTVLPGSSRNGLLPVLESASGKCHGEDFGFCYSPAFIALGEIIRNFKNPEFLLIGESDTRAGSRLEASYRDIIGTAPPCKRMTLENAELAKISINTFVTAKISFANMLSEICEQIPGGDVDVLSDVIGMDKRIGRSCLTGGLGFGGPCFPRDNAALAYFADAMGSRADLAETTDRFNRSIPERILQRPDLQISHGAKVAVLGLAYKPLSHWVEESQGLTLALGCTELGATVMAYDPLANETARQFVAGAVTVVDTIADCLAGAEIVLITTPDVAFTDLSVQDFNTGAEEVTIVDFWRILKGKLSGQPGIRYVAVGRSTDDDANQARLQNLELSRRQAAAAITDR